VPPSPRCCPGRRRGGSAGARAAVVGSGERRAAAEMFVRCSIGVPLRSVYLVSSGNTTVHCETGNQGVERKFTTRNLFCLSDCVSELPPPQARAECCW
jgi:hypothetical protein